MSDRTNNKFRINVTNPSARTAYTAVMEFFGITQVARNENWIKENLLIPNLNQFCDTIGVQWSKGNHGWVDTNWGEFEIHRQSIRGGVRFSLPECPNALAWTMTTGFPPSPGNIIIHCTINRIDHDIDFIESIQEFVQDWQSGLEKTAVST